MKKNIFIPVLLTVVCIWVNVGAAADKFDKNYKNLNLEKPANIGEATIDIGSVHNFFTNNTITKLGWESQTFLLGDQSFAYPSMMWLEGGYPENHYMYSGAVRIAIDDGLVHFSSYTSDDWTVKIGDSQAVSPFDIYFSFSDDLAGPYKKGITASQTVHAWSEFYRDDFFILEYDIFNSGPFDYDDCYLEFHVDSDVSTAEPGFYNLDDLTSYYSGIDSKGNPEFLSFIYDGDNPNYAGNDEGGKKSPKESLGYLGSRILECPPRTGEGIESANTQSGHQWWDWNSLPETDQEYYEIATRQEFKMDPGTPHDYLYMQIVGPFNLLVGDTIHVAIAFGLGEGLNGLRENMQWAYDLYWNNFIGPTAPLAPKAKIETGDRVIKVSWDGMDSESSLDPLSRELDFEGYRIYRSPDKIFWTLLADFDLIDNIGQNTGLPTRNSDGWYEFFDDQVTNGFLYYYAVSAYDQGTPGLPSLETGKQIDLFAQPGPLPTGNRLNKRQIRVVPNPFVVKAPWDFTPTRDNPSEERIQFQNVPYDAKITVFNLAGDMIIELFQRGENGVVDWDLISRNRQKVVSGIYLYVVEDSRGDSFIDKFVIVR